MNLDAPAIVIGGARPLSDLIGEEVRLVVCNEQDHELREIQGVIVIPGQTIRQAIQSQIGPGEHVEIRRNC